jgi:hypothetical protein
MNSHVRNRLVKLGRENAITIMNEETITMIGRYGLAQLLQCPGSRRMLCDITMHNSPCLVLDYYQDIEQPECCADDDTEITGQNG